jgi:hypothetical protein
MMLRRTVERIVRPLRGPHPPRSNATGVRRGGYGGPPRKGYRERFFLRFYLVTWVVLALSGLAVAVLAGAGGAAADLPAPAKPESLRWVYAPLNFQVDAAVDDLLTLMKRAKAAGYTGLLITDSKFGRMADRPAHYYVNLERTRQAAAALGLELIPACCPVGYSNDVLQNNPNLAEGIAVRDAPFIVQGKEAVLADRENLLPGGGFEELKGGKFAGWDWTDGPGVSTVQDAAVRHGGAAAVRMQEFRKGNEAGNCRLSKKLTLVPWRQYHLSVWIKTQDVAPAGDLRVAVIAPGNRDLNYTNLGVKATQDWTEHHIVFNAMEQTEAQFYIGLWGGRGGTIWVDDAVLRPCAGVNLLRRDGCPVRVTSEDGKTEYAEGKDFLKWEYPRMGRVPWPGEYEVYHPEPPLRLAEGSRLKAGQRLKVSYYHAVTLYDGQVSGCLRSDELFGYMEQTVCDLQKYFGAKKYFMGHDELRVAGQCALCRKEGETAGQVLAENVKRCAAMIRKIEPRAELFVWSDLFDPSHNAVDNYYLAGSSLKGSWEGLDPAIHIANWNAGRRDESLAWFAGRGHRQILAAYYDTSDPKAELEGWLKSAVKVRGVDGVLYTTWQRKYGDLEKFIEVLKAYK